MSCRITLGFLFVWGFFKSAAETVTDGMTVKCLWVAYSLHGVLIPSRNSSEYSEIILEFNSV